MRVLNLIVAIDRNRCIGQSGPIPLVWKQKEDMKRFKNITTGNVVIMGYNTFLSIGKPLPNRMNVVVTSKHFDELSNRNDITIAKNLEDAITLSSSSEKEIFLIGGGMLYNEAIAKDLVKRYHITCINTSLPENQKNCFVNFSKFDRDWEIEVPSLFFSDNDNEFDTSFIDIRRK